MRLVQSPRPPLALDTLKVQLPPGTPVNLRRGFQHVPRYDVATGELVSEKWETAKLGHGINGIVLPGRDVGPVLDLSAKVRGSSYGHGITYDSLEEVADTLTRTGTVEVTADALASADVKAADPVTGVHVGEAEIPRHLRAFGILEASDAFDVRGYKHEGIALNRTRRGGRDRLVIYAKFRELTSTKAGRAFLADAGPGVADWARGLLRAERHARRIEPIRRCAGRERGRVSLAELYATPRRPVCELYDEATKPLQYDAIADDFLGYVRAGLSPGKAASRVGRDRIFVASGYDLDRVRALLVEADALKGGHRNVSREMKHYRQVAAAFAAKRAAKGDPGEAAQLHRLLLDFGKRLRLAA